jgi:hypothetical protein
MSDNDNIGVPPGYSLEKTVHAISSFYKLLRGLYFLEDTVFYPPATSWPHITAETMAPLKKNATVIKLLNHITYFKAYGGQ